MSDYPKYGQPYPAQGYYQGPPVMAPPQYQYAPPPPPPRPQEREYKLAILEPHMTFYFSVSLQQEMAQQVETHRLLSKISDKPLEFGLREFLSVNILQDSTLYTGIDHVQPIPKDKTVSFEGHYGWFSCSPRILDESLWKRTRDESDTATRSSLWNIERKRSSMNTAQTSDLQWSSEGKDD
ncbi:hypothetical protein Cgig2_019471 [Carnegiea gigantea]|uniref:Uncharacterized protein n=1 Tax=Carnegiea gigantea TaxID=171969 RepID=A0A9Q1QM87_9CARY|nr:hypothetical protein Cgig2_019471 [Carnegiea gigantea]